MKLKESDGHAVSQELRAAHEKQAFNMTRADIFTSKLAAGSCSCS